MFKRSEGVELKPRQNKKPISQHPAFAPALVAWGAALAGAIVFVLPYPIVKRLTPQPIFNIIEPHTHNVAIAGAALFGALCMWLVARAIQRKSGVAPADAAEHDLDDVQVIDPRDELGSDSLDAPLDADYGEEAFDEGFEDEADFDEFVELEPEWVEDLRDDDLDDHADGVAAVDTLNDHLSGWAQGSQVGSRSEDMQIRNAAAAQSDTEEEITEPAPLKSAPPSAAQVETAVEKLRAVAPHELSLVQMVERLAVALHEQKRASQNMQSAKRRDAELAQALKALSRLTEDGLYDTQEAKSEVREAMAKLQNLRGAA